MIETIFEDRRGNRSTNVSILFGIFDVNKLLTKRTLSKAMKTIIMLIFLNVEKEFARRDSEL